MLNFIPLFVLIINLFYLFIYLFIYLYHNYISINLVQILKLKN